MPKIITLLTDFGLKDHYVASMKGVILDIYPYAVIVDISHDVPKYSIRTAAFILKCAYKYFPRGTIHVVVVDPGVGTQRRPIVVKTTNYYFVGPDNGVLMMAAQEDKIKEVYMIENPEFMRREISYTFHGRDIFAPTAAYLARGYSVKRVGRSVEDYIVPSFSRAKIKNRSIEGEIVHIDDFGNVITNISANDLKLLDVEIGEKVLVEIGGNELKLRLVKSFGYAEKGEMVLIIDSGNLLEISINLGNAAEELKVDIGDQVCIKLRS